MKKVSDHVTQDGGAAGRGPETDRAASVESYTTDGGVVFYDVDNPLAWLESTRTLSLEEQA